MTDHYYSKKPASKLKVKEISTSIKGKEIKLITSSGVFGKDKVDKGTILLIEKSEIKDIDNFSVLDLGCGYGVVGISIKLLYPKTEITCSDVNQRAINLTEKNSELNKVELISIQSDLFENIKEEFNTILVNLPQNAGKDICFGMIEQSKEHLKKDGTLQAVSRHQKGGKQYEKKMEDVFGNCETLARGGGYRIYISRKQ